MRICVPITFTCGLLASSMNVGSAMAAAGSPAPTAVFTFELDNTSPQPTQPAELTRLKKLDQQLISLLQASSCCRVIVADANSGRQASLWNCNGCDVDLASRLGARLSVVGWVQKVSNLILNINLAVRNVATGRLIEAGSVDIRGNTDEAWTRGLSYLIRNRLHVSEWN